jgi:hypothetical protein
MHTNDYLKGYYILNESIAYTTMTINKIKHLAIGVLSQKNSTHFLKVKK